ncbi:MAG: RNA polymerase sigma factor [bacterium]
MKANVERRNQNDILAACRRGSDNAFRELFEHYHRRVLHVAYRMCGNIQEAEDITQEVFLKVFKEINNFRATAGFFTWIYRITINLCLEKKRKHQRRQKYLVNAYLDSENTTIKGANSNTLDQKIWQDEMQLMLQKALTQIKPKLRTVMVLKDIEGLSYGEVAQIMGFSEGTVSSRLNRGRKQLKSLLSQMGLDKTYFQES